MQMAENPYPAGLSIETPTPMERWRPLVQWFLAIPHLVIAYALGYLAGIIGFISWFIILFTGKLPKGLAGLQVMYLRYYNRTYEYAGFLTTDYPPFAFDTDDPDPRTYPQLTVDLESSLEERNRLTVAFRFILVIPHMIVLFLLGIAVWFAYIVAFFAVLFTGKWPDGLRNFIIGVLRWSLRVGAYWALLTDEYPPFSLD